MSTTFKIATKANTEILIQFIREYYEFDCHPFNEATIRTALVNLLHNDSLGRVWLIYHDGNAIGYIIMTFSYSLESQGRDALIDEFYIQAGYRRQGIGKHTIQFVESVCSELQINLLYLEVERKNITAQSFYRQMGFEDHDRYLMTKWLAKKTVK